MSIEKAESFYKLGDYQSAQKIYETLIQQHPNTADLLFNLGNTYYRLGFKGKSIAAYLKAQALHPRDADLNANLDLVRSQVVGHTPQQTFNKVTLPEWSLILLLCLTAINALVLLKRKGKFKGELAQNVFYCISVLTFGVVLAWGYTSFQAFYVHKGVALKNEIQVKSGPDLRLSTLFALPEGTELIILETKQGWLKIQLKKGIEGWVNASDIESL